MRSLARTPPLVANVASAHTYRVKRSGRRTLAISVLPDGSIEVAAPQEASIARIEERLRARAAWIESQRRHFETYRPVTPAREYVSGETHLYLGRQYRLRIEASADENVSLRSGRFWILTSDPGDRERVRLLLRRWYRSRALVKLTERFERHAPLLRRLGLVRPALLIRDMSRSWGSHSKNGRITLNRDLIRAPSACIDYVITHEICHLPHPNHGPEFYALLDRLMPDWRARKMKLEKLLI